jgi:Phage-related minor tail protein
MAATIKIIIESTGGLDAVKKDVRDLGAEAEKSGGGFSSLREIGVSALRQIGSAAIDLAGQGLQKLGDFLVGSIQKAGDFQAQLQLFGAAAGKGFEPGTEALGQFKDLFISLGKELPVSTADVEAAAVALVKGGLDPATLKAGALRDSLNFAAAAGMGLADAAELTVKQLGTFVPIGASVEEQTKFMAESQNLLVKAAGASTLDVKELGTAMLAAGGQARAAGLDYNEFVTTMGLISPAFGSAAEAGTSFKNFLTRMNPTTKAATAAMNDLGLMTTNTNKIMDMLRSQGIQPLGTDLDTLGNQFTEWAAKNNLTAKQTTKLWDSFSQSKFFDMDGKFVGMSKASELLKGSLEGLSDQQRIAALQTIFGNDAMGAATALAGAGADGFAAFAQKMADANGVQAQSAATQQGFNFQLENMKGSLEALQITIGTAVLPVLASLIGDYLTPGINALMGWADQIGPLITQFQAFVTNGQAMQELLNTLLPYFTGLAAMILAAVVPAFVAWAAAAIPAAIATVVAMAPVILTVAAIGAAVALLTAAWVNDWGGIQEKTAAVWAIIKPIFDSVVAWLQVAIPAAIQVASDFWTNTLWPALQKVWAFIQDTLIPIIMKTAGEVFDALNSAVTTVAAFWTETLWPALQKVWAFIETYINPILTKLAQVYIALVKVEIAALSAIWNTVLLPALTAVWNFINANIIPIFTALVNVHIAALKAGFTALAAFWTGTFVPAMTTLYNFIYNSLAPTMATFNTNVLQPMAGWFENIGSAVDSLIGWLNTLADKWAEMKPPDWVKGASPPPMAHWFDYIAESVRGVSEALPTMHMNLAGPIGGSGGSSYSSSSSRSFTYAPQINTSGNVSAPMDLALASSLAGV